MFGYNYRNSLPYSTPVMNSESFLVHPTEDQSFCGSVDGLITIRNYGILDSSYHGQYGFSLFNQRNVTDASATGVASWGPFKLGETLDDSVAFLRTDFTEFETGARPTNYLDDLLWRRRERGVSKIFVGFNTFLVVTSDNNAYIWGVDTKNDILLTDPSGPSLLLPFGDSPMQIDQLGLLTETNFLDGLDGFVKDIRTFSPDPTDTFQTTIILSSSLPSPF
jgi:hypothetical protein